MEGDGLATGDGDGLAVGAADGGADDAVLDPQAATSSMAAIDRMISGDRRMISGDRRTWSG